MNIECSGIREEDALEIFAKTQRQRGRSYEDLLHSTGKIYRLDQILKALSSLSYNLSNDVLNSLKQHHEIDLRTNNFLNDGIVCKVLGSESSGWKPGKLEIRVQIDFIPDSPQEHEDTACQENDCESELDKLRNIA